jgi:hypothetical protein
VQHLRELRYAEPQLYYERFVFHRTPGFGDSTGTDVISVLRQGGFTGAIDIEGWHDPVCRDELEMTGQIYGLNYLKQCRGGAFVPDPTAWVTALQGLGPDVRLSRQSIGGSRALSTNGALPTRRAPSSR